MVQNILSSETLKIWHEEQEKRPTPPNSSKTEAINRRMVGRYTNLIVAGKSNLLLFKDGGLEIENRLLLHRRHGDHLSPESSLPSRALPRRPEKLRRGRQTGRGRQRNRLERQSPITRTRGSSGATRRRGNESRSGEGGGRHGADYRGRKRGRAG